MNSRIQHDYPIEFLFDLKPEHIDIPLDWTPAQADEMVTILGWIEERIWYLYGGDLIYLARENANIDSSASSDDNSNGNFEDDIPF